VHPDFDIREIQDDDRDAVVGLLCEGFPTRSPAYWRTGLDRLAGRERPPTTEKYGYALTDGDELHGAVLTIPSAHEGADGPMVLVNVSSWCARPTFRGPPAKELFRRASSRDDISYTDLSAEVHTIKTITGFGFEEWTAGQMLAVGVHRRGASGKADRVLTPAEAERAGLAPDECAVLADHERLGCLALCLETDGRLIPMVFVRRRIKGLLPCAQLIYCRDLTDLVDHGRQIWAWLTRRGFPLLLVDASAPVPGLTGRYVAGRSAKYVRGPRPGMAVDHTYSEMVLLGF